MPAPVAYAVFDCETTGTTPGLDEIVSLAAVRLDADGVETARFARLVRPSRPIPAEATAVHGIGDEDVVSAPPFDEIAREVYELLDGAVFVAHNAPFDLAMLKHAFALTGIDYNPVGVACTLDAFRLLEPLAGDHRLQSICDRRGIAFEDAHEALSDAPGSPPPARRRAIRAWSRYAVAALSCLPKTASARITSPIPVSTSALPTTMPNSEICSAM